MNRINQLPGGKIIDLILFPVLFGICLILAWFQNFGEKEFPTPPEIYSDKADYYVYLPATFIYNWDVNKLPKGIDKVTLGFTLDYEHQKLIVKTTYGVALLVSPFFLVTHAIAEIGNLKPDGFSDIYQKMTIFPGVFYLVLGLFFLRKFLSFYFRGALPYITVLLVFAGTNLYYYALDDCLMSHVYSFFLFSTFLFLLKKFLDSEKKPFGLIIWISLVFSIAVLIRPTNILLLLWVVFLDVRTWKEAGARLRLFLKPRYVLICLAVGFLVFLPQMFYWKYISGSYMYYSYPGESFSNWKDPRMIAIWFAPLNGLFLYSPLVMLFVVGMIYMIIRKIPNGYLTAFIFLLISYLFSSWGSWFFGGSFGYRPFVEYYSLFSLPFAYLLDFLYRKKNKFISSAGILLIILMVYYSLMFATHPFWNTSSTWAWDDYLKHAEEAKLYQWPGESYTFKDDFENNAKRRIFPQEKVVHSPTMAGYMDSDKEYSERISFGLWSILRDKPVTKVSASLWMNPGQDSLTGALFCCRIDDWKGNCLFFKALPADSFVTRPYHWAKIKGTFFIPEWIDPQYPVFFNIWNIKKKKMFYIDDIVLKFE